MGDWCIGNLYHHKIEGKTSEVSVVQTSEVSKTRKLSLKPLVFSIIIWYYCPMRKTHRKTLESIFAQPVRANIPWKDIVSLFVALDAEVTEGRGSRVRVVLNGVRAVFHRPHPQKETDKGAVKSVRRFLKEAGISL